MTIAGETFKPEPMSLERVVELVLLLAPYLALVEENWGSFRKALQNTEGERPRLLSALLSSLAGQIKPADITQAFAIMLNKPPEWFRTVKPVELVQALPVLDDVNDFAGLFEAIRGLGLSAKYKTG